MKGRRVIWSFLSSPEDNQTTGILERSALGANHSPLSFSSSNRGLQKRQASNPDCSATSTFLNSIVHCLQK